MTKSRYAGIVFVIAAVMVLVAGCGVKPVTVAQQFQEAINSQNVESALDLLSENASLNVGESLSLEGKSPIADWLTIQAKLQFELNGDPVTTDSGVSFENCLITSNQWSFYGIEAMSGTCTLVVEGGHVAELVIQYDENSKASLSDSSLVKPTDLVDIWTGEWPMPGADPFADEITLNYFQFIEDGSARLATSPDDLSINPDSEHPGARFKWSYENYVLNLQNDGPASEGYCDEQDVGSYLIRTVKNVSLNRIQFKLILDPCLYRASALPRVAAPWDAFLP